MTLDAKKAAYYEAQVIGGVLLRNETIDRALWQYSKERQP